jgi:hypothetical protein
LRENPAHLVPVSPDSLSAAGHREPADFSAAIQIVASICGVTFTIDAYCLT